MLNLVELGHLKLDHSEENVGVKVVDPRTLGLYPMGALNLVHCQLDSSVGNTAYKSITIAKDLYKESACWKVTKVMANDSIVQV